MNILKRKKSFSKDFKKLKLTDKHYSKYIFYLGSLLINNLLPTEAKDHSLKGKYLNFRECHISGDLLLIYQIKDNSLYLIRIGSHAELFE